MRSIRVLAFSLLLLACDGGDDGHDHHDHGGSDACQSIIDACHDVDPGSGEIHTCHETAHDEGTAAACDPIRTNCVALCTAAAADGGV